MNSIPITSLRDVKSYFGRHSYVREFVGDYLIASFRNPRTDALPHNLRSHKAAALRGIANAIACSVDYADVTPLLQKADALEHSPN